jgi:uncharacterized protein (DUF1501 family)
MKNALDRRALLKSALYSAPLFTAGTLYAAPASGPRLLVVFLRGAYDAANILVPAGSSFYYESRPTIAIRKEATLALDGDWGLHPALKDTILPLWQQKEIAFIPFAGTSDTSRSHFETQDTIELGQPVGGSRNYQSGFMSRTAQLLSGTRPISFTTQLPLTFRGGGSVPNIALNLAAKPAVGERNAALIRAMYEGQDLAPAVAQGFQVQHEVYDTFSNEMMAANRNAVTSRGFELSAQRIGVLMQDKFNLGFVDVGGWDTHVNQGGEQGYLSTRIAELGRGLSALKTALGPQWKDTLVIVVSEFGRTFRENGNRGTDHGHANVMFVMGGAIRGGKVYSAWPGLANEQLYEGRDLALTTDFRSVLGELVQTHLGNRDLSDVFPGYVPSREKFHSLVKT